MPKGLCIMSTRVLERPKRSVLRVSAHEIDPQSGPHSTLDQEFVETPPQQCATTSRIPRCGFSRAFPPPSSRVPSEHGRTAGRSVSTWKKKIIVKNFKCCMNWINKFFKQNATHYFSNKPCKHDKCQTTYYSPEQQKLQHLHPILCNDLERQSPTKRIYYSK